MHVVGIQRQADPIMPKNLGQIAPTPAEDIEIAGCQFGQFSLKTE
jgi:hypothetical protein